MEIVLAAIAVLVYRMRLLVTSNKIAFPACQADVCWSSVFGAFFIPSWSSKTARVDGCGLAGRHSPIKKVGQTISLSLFLRLHQRTIKIA